MERMTKTTIANLKIADAIGFDEIRSGKDFDETRHENGFDAVHSSSVIVWLERAGNRAYVCGSSGPLVYDSAEKARRNIKRVRPDLEPTSI